MALKAYDKLADGLFAQALDRRLLGWAADLHETGLGISHSLYHQHSGYLVENSDMTGFTRQEQMFLAALVRYHRREIPSVYTDLLPTRLHEPLRTTLVCLRFACILCRSRDDDSLPRFRLSGGDNRVTVGFDEAWMQAHPLTLFDLKQEARALAAIGIKFRVDASPGS